MVYDIGDALDAVDVLDAREKIRLVECLLDEGNVPKGWMHRDSINLSDGMALLNVIVELRRRGFTVEPGGE